eukprot:TRINITY_DN19380_c0_g1_i7.p1 TRINITY_DN19380_c0_g1~~TRINITY_DN19380_c0_g1_i7.p1  ORF type:complete len:159 (-),score=13.30 TRINITY_DN19380_c0_g1_i7:209-658(-)
MCIRDRYPAVAGANVSNLIMMRRSELSTGIDIRASSDGTLLGTSQEAAKVAIGKTAFTRIILPVPLLVVPPVIMLGLEKSGIMKSVPRKLRMPIEVGVISLCFTFGLPLSLSAFPQYCEASVNSVESRFHHYVDRSGNKVDRIVFNRGL